ncbi:MAG: DUF3836 domain-containing protein [Bacteroidaceae bacterium]|nr:DUF3836 domain-containing protein [Bacteroidaceae bacterium]
MTHNFKLFIAAAATMAATLVNASNKLPENKPVVVADPAPSVITKTIPNKVLLTTNSKGEDIKYEYTTDEQGRVTTKVCFTWNEKKGKWQPLNIYMIYYSENETVLTYADYDKYRGSFRLHPQQIRFDANDYPNAFIIPSDK